MIFEQFRPIFSNSRRITTMNKGIRPRSHSVYEERRLMKTSLQVLICTGILLVLSGCVNVENTGQGKNTPGIKQWVGQNVRVQFRRDALGAAAPVPVDPNTGSLNGASTMIVGKLLKVESDGIYIESARIPGTEHISQKWIPREVILFVETNP